MKRRGIPSPDVADAFALTFAYNVARWEEPGEPLAGLWPVFGDWLLIRWKDETAPVT